MSKESSLDVVVSFSVSLEPYRHVFVCGFGGAVVEGDVYAARTAHPTQLRLRRLASFWKAQALPSPSCLLSHTLTPEMETRRRRQD
jgi:hypothetical protein